MSTIFTAFKFLGPSGASHIPYPSLSSSLACTVPRPTSSSHVPVHSRPCHHPPALRDCAARIPCPAVTFSNDPYPIWRVAETRISILYAVLHSQRRASRSPPCLREALPWLRRIIAPLLYIPNFICGSFGYPNGVYIKLDCNAPRPHCIAVPDSRGRRYCHRLPGAWTIILSMEQL